MDNAVSKSSSISSDFDNDVLRLLLLLLTQYFLNFVESMASNARIDGVSDCKCFSAIETADSPENGNSPVNNS